MNKQDIKSEIERLQNEMVSNSWLYGSFCKRNEPLLKRIDELKEMLND